MDNFNIKIMSCCHKKIERDEERERDREQKKRKRENFCNNTIIWRKNYNRSHLQKLQKQ